MANLRIVPGPLGRAWSVALLAAAAALPALAAVAQTATAPPSFTAPALRPATGAGPGLLAPPAAGPSLPPPAEEQVVEVRIEGNEGVAKERILPHIRTRAGRPFRQEMVEEDVRQLNRTRLFINVETFTQQVPGGRVVIFRVVERPILREVRYVGNQKIKEKVLKKETDLKTGDAADPFAVEEARRKIEEFYRSKGFSKVRVTIIEGNRVEDRRAIFLINEGIKQRVLWTHFVGNTISSEARLRTQVRSKPGILWFFRGEVDQKQIDEDVNRLIAYYRGLGFFQARIGRELEYNEAQSWLTLTFVVDEGPRYKVRNVAFVGNTKFTTEDLIPLLTLKDHQYFNQGQMTKDITTIQEKYGSIGYVFADVKADTRFLEEPGTLDLAYHVGEGDRYRVGKIDVEIKGESPHTRLTTVLNRISLSPGEIVDIRKLRASERRLRASGLFLVDPAQGVEPKIVFSPPGGEDEKDTEIAGRPKSPKPSSGVRGQSPDLVPCGAWIMTPSPNSRAGDRRVDLTLPCQWNTRDGRPSVDLYADSQPGPQYQAQYQPGPPARQEPPTIVRGQYSPDAGWQVPPFSPRVSRPAAPRAQSVTTVPPPTGSLSNATPAAGGTQVFQPVPSYNPAPSGQVVSPSGAPPAAVMPPYSVQPAAQPYANQAPVPGPGPYVGGPPPFVRPQPQPQAQWQPQQPAVGGVFSEDSPFNDLPKDDATRPLDLGAIAQETQTGRLMFGVGINSDAGLVGSVVIDEQNFDWTRIPTSWEDIRSATAFRGRGQRFRLEAVPGTQVQRYMVTFQEPYLMDTAVSLGLSGYYFGRRYREWTEQRLGGRVSLGYQFTHDLSGSIAYRGARIKIFDPIVKGVPEIDEVLGDNALHGFGASLAHDTRDSTFLATEGHLVELSVEQVIGTFQYPRVDLDLRRYFLLHERPDGSGRHVLSLGGRFGWSGEDTPVYDHYFAGGFSTLRGFDFRGASPRDPVYHVLIGGEFMLLARAEYLFPITADDMLRGVVFCDTGTVEPTINNWSDDYRVAPGFGLRITIPAMGPAPIALDFAFPVLWNPRDDKEMFSFFVGFNH